ncbi:hypothetical protein BY458DRAFT_520410 [Sporodiniella umbellata]|nr:hypothetical protein BY458DRAFT_520410 [Sporodiniella umbellata]
MSNEVAQHRFVQIHQACDLTADSNKMWSALSQTSLTRIAVSNACERIIDLVNRKELDVALALRQFQNLILSSNDSAKTAIYLNCIGLLYLKAVDLKFGLVKSDQTLADPFVAILRQNPSLYLDVLNEADTLIRNNRSIETVIPLILFVLLTENSLDYNALLAKISLFCANMADKESIQLVYHTIGRRVMIQHPMQINPNRYLSIIDFLEALSLQYKEELELETTNWIGCYCYPILDRAVMCASTGAPILPYVSRIERLYQNVKASEIISENLQASFSLLWSSYSFLLLKAQTLDEQQYILNFIRFCINHGNIPKHIMHVAYLPLFQTLSELMDKTASKNIQAMKEDVLSIIHSLDEASDMGIDQTMASISIAKLIKANNISGPLAHIATYVVRSYLEVELSVPNKSISDVSKDMDLLFTTPSTLSDDTKKQFQALNNLSSLCSTNTTNYKFPVLLYLLHIIRHSSEKPSTLLHVFHKILPSLTDSNDTIITSKVLQIIISVISTENDTPLAALGVRSLAAVCKRQPRVWQELKKVFTDWISRRKSRMLRRKIDLTMTGPIKVELAVLTTMRDMCQFKPEEYASDVLPMAISLLQSCQDLSMASLSLIMDIICTCIETGFVECRSLWSIVVVYLAQFSIDAGIERSLLLVKQLCRFYALAGEKDEVTEPYLQFKETILTTYILPLLDPENSCEKAKTYALEALSRFSSNDISKILPEKSRDYLDMILDSNEPNKSYKHILVKLMSNELNHMRRGLFKEESNKPAEPVPKRKTTRVGEQEREFGRIFAEKLSEGHVAPGLRAGYAMGILEILDFSSEASSEHTLESIAKTRWYRTMITSFTDITLTDHLLVRVSSISSWDSFFQSVLNGKEVDVEAISSILLKDLLTRLERSTVPGVSSNILLAITGLIGALRLTIPSFAGSSANEVVAVLLKNYINVFGSPLSHSAHLMSEEVQFAARFALGHLSTHIISNEKTATSLSQILIDAATKTQSKYRNIDSAVDLVQFANGYAAAHFIGSVVSWPTKTDNLDLLGKQGIYRLLDYCNSSEICDSRVLGILMGWSSRLNPIAMEEVIWLAKDVLGSYLTGNFASKGLLLGSAWLIGMYGAIQGDDADQECLNFLESAVTKASVDIQLAQHFYHFSVPYAHFCRSRFIKSSRDEDESCEDYTSLFQREFENIQKDDPSSNYRIASLFNIGSLLGVVYLAGEQKDHLFTESRKYSSEARSIVWEKLIYVAGLLGRSAPVGNLKSGRVAAAICGKIIGASEVIANASQITDGSTAPERLILSTSSEPGNYGRLNQNTSYIRAVFDNLVELTAQKDKNELQESIYLLLSSLHSTPGPLPSVNWFALIDSISKLSEPLRCLCVHFASTHSYASLSLTEFLFSQLNMIIDSTKQPIYPQLNLLLSSEIGLGRILELSGLPTISKSQKESVTRRGMNAVTKKTSISDSRCLEIVEGFAKRIMAFEEDAQMQFFATLFNHIPEKRTAIEENKTKLSDSIKSVILQQITLPFSSRVQPSSLPIFRQCVSCSLTSPDQLSEDGSEDSVFNNTLSAESTLGRVAAISELYLAANKGTQKQALVRYVVAAIVYLVGQPSTLIFNECWTVIAQTIQKDCCGEQDILGWITRVLDGFIVYGNSKEASANNVRSGMIDGLLPILSYALGQPVPKKIPDSDDRDIQLADTVYKMAYTIEIGSKYPTEQEQIALRMFTLIDSLERNSSESFGKVVRNCPYSVLNKGTTPYIKWIVV